MADVSDKPTLIPNATFRDMYKRYKAWVKKNGVKPNIVYLNKNLTGDYVTCARFEDMMDRVLLYEKGPAVYINKGGVPSAPAWDGVYREQKHSKLDQDDAYSCGSHTAQNILSTWGITISDKDARAYCKTGTHGTNPEDLDAGILRKLRESGYTARVRVCNSSSLGPNITKQLEEIGKLISDPKIAVACLVNTGGAGWKKYYAGAYEHWVMPIEVNTNNRTIVINDPARSYDPVFTYEAFMTGVALVPRMSWHIYITE